MEEQISEYEKHLESLIEEIGEVLMEVLSRCEQAHEAYKEGMDVLYELHLKVIQMRTAHALDQIRGERGGRHDYLHPPSRQRGVMGWDKNAGRDDLHAGNVQENE